jgi:hypothetical protein
MGQLAKKWVSKEKCWIATSLPPTELFNNSKKLNIWFRYLAPTSVGRKISDIGDRGTPSYRREGQESSRPRRLEMLWIWEVD